jgi:uncharacterized protein
MSEGCNRRAFVKGTLAASTALGLVRTGSSLAEAPVQATEATKATLPQRALGKTGRQVSIYGLGGLFTVSMHDRHPEAVEIVNRAIDLGVNYIDTSAWYGTGASELNIGTVMKKRRNEVFLASKSHDYTYDGTMALFDQTLKRLQTDHLDLYQHHMLGRFAKLEQLQQKHSAREAFEKLRDQGAIRYIGVTAHSSRVLADALEDYPYDCALITLNAAGAVMDDAGDLDRFFREAKARQVGVVAMKVVGRGALVKPGMDVRRLLHYVLSHPVSTAIVGISAVSHLEENVRVARAFEPLDEKAMAEVRAAARA